MVQLVACRLDPVCEIFSSRLRKLNFGSIHLTCAFKQHKMLLPPLPFRKKRMNLRITLCQHSNGQRGVEAVSKTRSGSSSYRSGIVWWCKIWGIIQRDGSDEGSIFHFKSAVKLICSITGIMFSEIFECLDVKCERALSISINCCDFFL